MTHVVGGEVPDGRVVYTAKCEGRGCVGYEGEVEPTYGAICIAPHQGVLLEVDIDRATV